MRPAPRKPCLVYAVAQHTPHRPATPVRNAGNRRDRRRRARPHRRSCRLAVRLDPCGRRIGDRRPANADPDTADAGDLRADRHLAWRRGDARDTAWDGNLSAQYCGPDSRNGGHFRRRRRVSAACAPVGDSRFLSCGRTGRHVASAGARRRARGRPSGDRDRAKHPRCRDCRRPSSRPVAARTCRPCGTENDRPTQHRYARRAGHPARGIDRRRDHRLSNSAFRAGCSSAPCSPLRSCTEAGLSMR